MKNKWLFFGVILAVAAGLALTGCPTEPKYSKFFAVESISGVETTGVVGIPLHLTGNVHPPNATNRNIFWFIEEDGGTGSVIEETDTGFFLTAERTGSVFIGAVITDGVDVG